MSNKSKTSASAQVLFDTVMQEELNDFANKFNQDLQRVLTQNIELFSLINPDKASLMLLRAGVEMCKASGAAAAVTAARMYEGTPTLKPEEQTIYSKRLAVFFIAALEAEAEFLTKESLKN